MLSGIGPRAALAALGLHCRRDLPGVGANLQDRYEVGIVARAQTAFGLLSAATFSGPAQAASRGAIPCSRTGARASGLYATNGAVVAFIEKSSVAENDEPDLFMFGVPGAFVGYKTDWAKEATASPTTSGPGSCSRGTRASRARSRSRAPIRCTTPWSTSTTSSVTVPERWLGAPPPTSAMTKDIRGASG